MAPTILTSETTSGAFYPVNKSHVAAANADKGLALDSEGPSTPISTSSTAVSESGDSPKSIVDSNLPSSTPSDSDYYTSILAASLPTPSTKAGTIVYSSAIDVLEALAVKHSASVWVYDDAVEVGFGSRLASFGANSVQTRDGAGLELAGYAAKSKGLISVFASTTTLPYLLPNLAAIKGDVTIHLATTSPSETLTLQDSSAGIYKTLASIEGWEVVFSAGKQIVETASKLYSNTGKVIHVVESTYSGREVTSYEIPELSSEPLGFTYTHGDNVTIVPAGVYSSTAPGTLVLETLTPSAEELLSVISGKTVMVQGPTKADADALRTAVLSVLYSASTSSTTVLPSVKSAVAQLPSTSNTAKTISFYSAPSAPLPQLLAHLFLSSPTLTTRLAEYGSASARGVKSVLALSPAADPVSSLSPSEESQVVWVSDANVLKTTDVLRDLQDNGILVLQLPWSEEEVPVKLTRKEIIAIKSRKIRVFLLDPSNPIQSSVAFLLLYTGAPKLPAGVTKVLDAFYHGYLGREEIEEAQASLSEIPDVASWEVPELEEGKVDKEKSVWEWDSLPEQAGVSSVDEAEPKLAGWQLAAKHLLFKEAFGLDNSLRPTTPDETFLVTVSENRRLTPMTYDRNVFHMEFDTAGTGLKYEIGEAIGIHGWNDTAEVMEFINWYGLSPDALVTFPNPLKAGTMETRTIFQLLQQNLDLFGKPGKAFYASLSKLATTRAEAMALKFISAPEGAELFKKLAEKETVTFADILRRYKTARPSIEELVGLIPEIKPRHYSIASSQKAVGDKVELLIVTVDWVDSKGSPRYGQCTRYLADLKPGAKVTVSIKPSVMKLPPDDRQPVIMAGLGTGAAPFRAFMQHRAWQRTQGIEVGPLIYYFGSRYRSQEYLYGEEIEAYIASGIISHAGLAFSRDGKDKVYIQHKMGQDKELLAKSLMGHGKDAAYFYLCGPTWPVPDVYEALVKSLVEVGGKGREEAEKYIEELKEEERYVLEVY